MLIIHQQTKSASSKIQLVQEVCEIQRRWAAPHVKLHCAWRCFSTIKPCNICTFPFMCLTAILCFLVYHKHLFLLSHYHALNYVPTLQANKLIDVEVYFEQTHWKDCCRLLITKVLLVHENFMIHCLFVNVSSAKTLFHTNRAKHIYPVPFFSLYFKNTSMHIQLFTSFGDKTHLLPLRISSFISTHCFRVFGSWVIYQLFRNACYVKNNAFAMK